MKNPWFKDLKPFLTGFVREVKYKDGILHQMTEGFMVQGDFSGFARMIQVSP